MYFHHIKFQFHRMCYIWTPTSFIHFSLVQTDTSTIATSFTSKHEPSFHLDGTERIEEWCTPKLLLFVGETFHPRHRKYRFSPLWLPWFCCFFSSTSPAGKSSQQIDFPSKRTRMLCSRALVPSLFSSTGFTGRFSYYFTLLLTWPNFDWPFCWLSAGWSEESDLQGKQTLLALFIQAWLGSRRKIDNLS